MESKRVIVITGVSSGIGRELVHQLTIDENNLVIGISRNKERLDALKSELTHPSRCELIVGDISNPVDIETTFAYLSKLGKVDVLIHNAGSLLLKPLSDITPSDLQAVYSTNVFGPSLLSARLFPLLRKVVGQEHSHIVHISSMGGVQGVQKFAGLSAYSSSKAAIIGMAECMAEEWRNDGIRTNVLAIGSVNTEMFREAFPGMDAATTPEVMAGFIADFAVNGHRLFNGKVLQVSNSTP